MISGELKKEDYEEPQCLLRMDKGSRAPLRSVPMGRVIEKLDEYLGRDDWAGAEHHLDYWLAEAKDGRDQKAELAIQCERMGLFRKRGRRKEAMEAVSEALRLIGACRLEDSVTAGTAYVNIATVYKTFGEADEALPYFGLAQPIYESALPPADSRLGGLYNNMALALADLGSFDKARAYYGKALGVMTAVPGREPEQAITYLNLADLETAQHGPEEAEETVQDLLAKARACLDTPSLPRNGYYAYVCECCAPCFEHYGWFMDAEELRGIAQRIYSHTSPS